jgi:hypothetical protein
LKHKKNLVFTNKHHSPQAILSMILGLISFSSLCIVCFFATKAKGSAPISYGLTGLLALIYSVAGMILGVRTVRQRDQYRFFSWAGIVLNTLSLCVICLILYCAAYMW